jgi:TonB family protein
MSYQRRRLIFNRRAFANWQLCGAAAILLVYAAGAQSSSDYQAKSAYLYKFAKMTRWPAEVLPESSTLIIGVYGGDEDFLDVLRTTVMGKRLGKHPIEVRRLESSSEFKSCHLIFVRSSAKDIENTISQLGSASILLVGEDKDFLSRGGMINFVQRARRVEFEVNSAALNRARLKFAQQGGEETDNGTAAEAELRVVKQRVTPLYPDIARRMSVVGAVQLQAVVRADGTVKEVHVLGGHPLLADAASRAVLQWRYQPSSRETTELVRVDFGN